MVDRWVAGAAHQPSLAADAVAALPPFGVNRRKVLVPAGPSHSGCVRARCGCPDLGLAPLAAEDPAFWQGNAERFYGVRVQQPDLPATNLRTL